MKILRKLLLRLFAAIAAAAMMITLVPSASQAAWQDHWSGGPWAYSHTGGGGNVTWERNGKKRFLGFYQSTTGGNDGYIWGKTSNQGQVLCGAFKDDYGPYKKNRGTFCAFTNDGQNFSGWFKVCKNWLTCKATKKIYWSGSQN